MNRLVRFARRAIRLRVRILYGLALAVGNGNAADRCREWLDGDGLYPPDDPAYVDPAYRDPCPDDCQEQHLHLRPGHLFMAPTGLIEWPPDHWVRMGPDDDGDPYEPIDGPEDES